MNRKPSSKKPRQTGKPKEESLSVLRKKPNFRTDEYRFSVSLPYSEIKKGMMVLEEDVCDKPNPIPYMCEVVEAGMGSFDLGDGQPRCCHEIRIVAYSNKGRVIHDWTIQSMVLDEPEEDPERDVFFRTAEEAARFGIEPSRLQILDVWPLASIV